MRSQSAAMVLPYDLFLFTMLHEAMASRVGVPLGKYHHFCGSLHYYQDEELLVKELVAEAMPKAREIMPPMLTFSEEIRQTIVAAEVSVRGFLADDAGVVDRSDFQLALRKFHLNSYWHTLFEGFFGKGIQATNELLRHRRVPSR